MSDAQTIERHRFCMELAKESNFAIKISGSYFRLIRLPLGDLVGAFQNLDDLYNYLLGYRDGVASAK